MRSLTAIETRYRGFHFRSRIEARWAVLWDALGVRFEYEREAFELAGRGYLPDFWLPDLRLWVEIKGDPDRHDQWAGKCRRLVDATHQDALLVYGGPDTAGNRMLLIPRTGLASWWRLWGFCTVCRSVGLIGKEETYTPKYNRGVCISHVLERPDTDSFSVIKEAYYAAMGARFEPERRKGKA